MPYIFRIKTNKMCCLWLFSILCPLIHRSWDICENKGGGRNKKIVTFLFWWQPCLKELFILDSNILQVLCKEEGLDLCYCTPPTLRLLCFPCVCTMYILPAQLTILLSKNISQQMHHFDFRLFNVIQSQASSQVREKNSYEHIDVPYYFILFCEQSKFPLKFWANHF
jgi:hypothetical protein